MLRHESKAVLYKNCVFKFLVKKSAETVTQSENGRLFHARGAANARSPSEEAVCVCVGWKWGQRRADSQRQHATQHITCLQVGMLKTDNLHNGSSRQYFGYTHYCTEFL